MTDDDPPAITSLENTQVVDRTVVHDVSGAGQLARSRKLAPDEDDIIGEEFDVRQLIARGVAGHHEVEAEDEVTQREVVRWLAQPVIAISNISSGAVNIGPFYPSQYPPLHGWFGALLRARSSLSVSELASG